MAVALLAACATGVQPDAQWTDPQLGPGSGLLRSARILVGCEARDEAILRICQDHVAAEITARGATPVFAGPGTPIVYDRPLDAQLLNAARSLNAVAVFVVAVAPAVADQGSGFSIGIGGFGFGRHSGVGVGAAIPIGGSVPTVGYSANGRVTPVSTGRLAWTASATAAPSSDLHAQFDALAKAVVASAERAGLF
jgi:hypothetical protein